MAKEGRLMRVARLAHFIARKALIADTHLLNWRCVYS